MAAEILTEKQVDWTESLGQHYKRQSDQYAEYQRNLREVDQQRVNAEQGIDPWISGMKNVGSIAQFSVTVANKIKENKQEKTQAEWDDKTEEEKIAHRFRWELDHNNILETDTKELGAFKKRLQALGYDPKEINLILGNAYDLSGSELARFQAISAREQVSLFTPGYIEQQLKENGSEWKKYSNTDHLGKSTIQRTWINKKLEELGYTDKVRSIVDPEIERILGVTQNVKKNQALVKSAAARVDQGIREFTTAANIKDSNLAQVAYGIITKKAAFYNDTEGGLTAKQKAAQDFVGELYRLGEQGDLSRDAFNRLKEGIITDSKGKTLAMGSSIADFIGKDIFDEGHILDGIEKGENLDYSVQQAKGENLFSSIYNKVKNEEIQIGTPEWNSALISLNNLPLKNRQSKLDELTLIANNDQSQEAGIKILDTYKDRISTGKLTKDKDTINKIGHIATRNYLQQKEKSQTIAANAVNLDSHIKGFNGKISAGKRGPFGISGVTDATRSVQLDVENYFRRSYFAKVDTAEEQGQVPNYAVLLEEAKIETRTYMTDNGFGITDINNERYGKFSINGTKGDYDNYVNNYSVTKDNATNNYDAKLTVENAVQWEKNYHNNPNKTDYKIPGAIFTNEMLAGFLQTGRPSAEMLYIASKHKTNISRLIGFSIDALINNPRGEKDKAFVGNFNIKQVDTIHLPDETLLTYMSERIKVLNTRPLEATKVQDLNTIRLKAQRRGFDSLSQNEVQRFLLYMDNSPSAIPEDISKGVTETLEDEKERKEAIKAGRELDKTDPTDYI